MLQPIEQAPLSTREQINHAVAITGAAVAELEQLLLAAIAARAVAMAYESTEEIEAAKEAAGKAIAPGWQGRQAIQDVRNCVSRAKSLATEARQAAKEYDRIGTKGQPE